jgi:hypothetical protein
MSVVEPRPNPETVEALLDTAWRVAATEQLRTEGLDRQIAALATFSSILVSVVAIGGTVLGKAVVPEDIRVPAAIGFASAIASLTAAVVVGVVASLPKGHIWIGVAYLRTFPTWRVVRRQPADMRGDVLRTLTESVASERTANDAKTRNVRLGFLLLLLGIFMLAVNALTLTAWSIAS